jgi:DNA-binding CsgD family transcriptional regulator
LRSGDPGGERGELVRLLGEARRLALGPLGAAAVAAIVRAELHQDADEPFCAACSELTDGNPLFVRELVAASREQGLSPRSGSVEALRRIAPAAVGTSVLVRLGRLGAESVALARAVAVLGAGAEVALAARLADLDPGVAELTADRLAAAQILAPVRPLEFFHPLIGAAVLEDMAAGARRVAHRRAAELIDRDSAGQGSVARVAAHLLACGPAADRWVVQRLGDAAREALDRGAPEIAATYVRRALTEPPGEAERAALLLSLGIAEGRAGQPEAIAHLEQALVAAGSDHRVLIGASARLARAYYYTDRAERAVEVLERTLAAVGDTDPALALRLEAAAAQIGVLDERTAPAAVRRGEALHARLSALANPPVDLLVVLAFHAARANRAAEAQELAERALACEGYPPPLALSGAIIVTLGVLERYDALDRLCGDVREVARRRDAVQELAQISVHRAWASYERGALADAEAEARWALEHADGVNRVHAVAELLKVLIDRDELGAAEDVLERSVDPRPSRSIEAARFLFARGGLHGAQGRLREARRDFLECGQLSAGIELVTFLGAAWRGEAALVSSALGDTGEARRLADEQLELARAFGRPRTLGISLRVCGRVEGGEVGLDLLGEAVTTLERSQSPLELARALSDYGAALRRVGRRVRARAALERALDLAHRCGARRIAAGARAELIAAGAKPRRDAVTGRDALTAGELRVARLAAEGLTNRDIAQALFVTTSTAKAHLNRVYRKLDITRRDQLPGALTGPIEHGREGPHATATIS